MKRLALLLIAVVVPILMAGPVVSQPITVGVGAETSYTIPDQTVRLSIHPLVAVYLKSVESGAEFPIAANATLVLDGAGMSGKTLYFESQSAIGYVEFLAETK